MASFYESISAYYDDIFTASAEAVRFLDKRSGHLGRILDIACGTGSHALELARLGHRVTGVDLDGAMIARAREKSGELNVEFSVGDMLRLEELFSRAGCFNLAYCIGNSLVHLKSEDQVCRVLKSIHRLLATGGRFVVQIVNYDRILHYHVVELPTISPEAKNIVFKRTYEYGPESRKVAFKTELITVERGEEKKTLNSIPLIILKSGTLKELVARAGFQDIRLYGSFDEAPHSLQTFPLILSAVKN